MGGRSRRKTYRLNRQAPPRGKNCDIHRMLASTSDEDRRFAFHVTEKSHPATTQFAGLPPLPVRCVEGTTVSLLQPLVLIVELVCLGGRLFARLLALGKPRVDALGRSCEAL